VQGERALAEVTAPFAAIAMIQAKAIREVQARGGGLDVSSTCPIYGSLKKLWRGFKEFLSQCTCLWCMNSCNHHIMTCQQCLARSKVQLVGFKFLPQSLVFVLPSRLVCRLLAAPSCCLLPLATAPACQSPTWCATRAPQWMDSPAS
jgi:hypothetical protein